MSGEVEVLHVNTYGNHNQQFLQKGFCFKLRGYEDYVKLRYYDAGEQRANFDYVQSMVLAAYMGNKPLKLTYVDWGESPTCRVRGSNYPAKWLEDLQFQN